MDSENMSINMLTAHKGIKRRLSFDTTQGETIGDKQETKKKCVCTCCHRVSLLRNECVIFNIRNYNMNIHSIQDALSNRYCEVRSKEMICKTCNEKLLITGEKVQGNFSALSAISSQSNSPSHASTLESTIEADKEDNVDIRIDLGKSEQTSVSQDKSHSLAAHEKDNRAFMCTCCRAQHANRRKYIALDISKYDLANTVVQKALTYRIYSFDGNEFICKICHYSLSKCALPLQAVASPTKVIKGTNVQCITCGLFKEHKMKAFQRSSYGSNPQLDALLATHRIVSDPVICVSCHRKYQQLEVISCVVCNTQTIRKYSVFYNTKKFPHHLYMCLRDFTSKTSSRHICLKCHSVSNDCSQKDVSSHKMATNYIQQLCICCGVFKRKQMRQFVRCKYGKNSQLDTIISSSSVGCETAICPACHAKYVQLSIFECCACNCKVKEKTRVLYNTTKYPHHSLLSISFNAECDIKYICRKCHLQDRRYQKVCISCARSKQVKSCLVYDPCNYNFSHFIVSRCLAGSDTENEGNKYICKICDRVLRETTNEKPVVPRNIKNPIVKSASKFLQSLNEFPEYVCTCCHRMLFFKTVMPFVITDFDITNSTVQKCLRYRTAIKFAHEKDATMLFSLEKDKSMLGSKRHICEGNITVPEFICKRCRNSLRQKKPRMPDQACANGLMLYDIPDELINMFPIERRVLSFRIPFITLVIIRRYGGHYKINGAPVNVPATLDQIVEMLPRMPDQLQLHPLKLKRRLQYKSHYMYDMIRKDKVVGALMWLKENNSKYSSVPIDTTWLNDSSSENISIIDQRNMIANETGTSTILAEAIVEKGQNMSNLLTETGAEQPTLYPCIQSEGCLNAGISDNTGKNVNDIEQCETNSNDDETDDELAEDQAAIDARQAITGDPLPSMVQFDNLENIIYNCAPGENNTPKYILMDEDFEILAFPDLFPYGSGGYHSSRRECDLHIRKYFQQRLLNVDGRFAKNLEYIFCAQYISDIQQIQSDANLAIRLSRGRTLNGNKITAGTLRDPVALQNLIRTEQAYKFLKNVRGSPAYWQSELYDVLAMLKSLGIPTWFLTLSAADLHWPEMTQAIACQYGIHIPKDVVNEMSVADKSLLLRQNPVTSVRMFLHRVEAFFSEYLLSSAHPIGHITDHVIKIEFQMRGSPHAHCLLWVKDAPKIDKDDDSVVCAFIDRYISGCLPDNDHSSNDDRKLMLSLQKHSHSDYCRRNKKCRFGFPKPPSLKTLISRKPAGDDCEAVVEGAKDILKTVQDELQKDDVEQGNNLTHLLTKLGISPGLYEQSLKVSPRGPTVVLRRNTCDVNINSSNRDILRLWGANVDLQYVVNEVATVMYVCSYMTKGEKAMGETLKRVARECKNDDIRTQMNKIKKEFLGKRVVGAPESCMRVLSSWLMKKSRKVTYVNTNMKDERVSLPKKKAQLDKMHPDDDDVFATSLLDRYRARPNSISDLCLATFAVNYDVVSSTNARVNNENTLTDRGECTTIIKLNDGLGYMRKRKKPSILRVKKFKITTEPERYYHGKIILYYPWKNEDELLEGFTSYELSYQAKSDIIQKNAEEFNDDCEVFDISPDEFENNNPTDTVWDLVAPSIAQDDALTDKLGFKIVHGHNEQPTVPATSQSDQNSTADLPSEVLSKLYYQAANRQGMLFQDYCKYMRGLNAKQTEIVMYNRRWCKDYIHKYRLGEKMDGYHIFLSGCGGTGKSHTVHLIQRDMAYLLQHILRPDPDQPIVLVTAPTGSAAYNIGGSTIHSALSMNDKSKKMIAFEKQCIMQVKLEHLTLLITDEISMVGFDFFQRMNEVVTSIKRSVGGNWGGICILAVGDLYQLPPVAAAPIYLSPQNVKNLNDMAPNGWEQFQLHELVQVMRQNDDFFITALNNIRVRQPEQGSLEDEMLRSREVSCSSQDIDYPYRAMHVFAQNIYCDEWNEKMLERTPGELVTHVATDSRRDTSTNLANIKLSDRPRDTGNLRHTLHLKVGARVMLTTNVDVSDGLTNGTMGTVSNIIADHVQNAIKVVLVIFDGENVGLNAKNASIYKQINASAVPIMKTQATFTVSGQKSCHASRTQFPLTLAWAVTIHKCQGLTLEEIVVDMSPKKGKYTAGQAYVAFSRVRELSKLHIINYTRLQIRVSPHVETEMERLQSNALQYIPDNILKDNSATIKLAHINICNIMLKLPDIRCEKLLSYTNVISFNETHLMKGSKLESQMLGISEHFDVFRCDRNERGGGVALLTHKSLMAELINVHANIEFIAVKVFLPQPMVFITTYRPPTTPMKQFMDKISYVLSLVKCEHIALIGDFNEDILLSDIKPCCSMLKSMNFDQYVSKPTRDSGTLIDHVYMKPGLNVATDVMDCYYSDHDFVVCTVDFT